MNNILGLKEVNAWALPAKNDRYKDKISYFNTFADLKELLMKGVPIYVIDSFIPCSGKSRTILDDMAAKEGYILNYTDASHSIMYYGSGFSSFNFAVVSSDFYNSHRDELLDTYYNSCENTFCINDEFFYDEERFKSLLPIFKKEHITVRLKGNIELSPDIVRYLKENFISCFLNGEEVSSKYVFRYYTMENLKLVNFICLFPEDNLENIKYLNDGTEVNIGGSIDRKLNMEFYEKIINYAENNHIHISLVIDLNKVLYDDLINSPIFNKEYTTICVNIDDKSEGYSLEEYRVLNSRLENMISEVKKADLSPLEKYFAVYDIVKQYKKYKENEEDKKQSRYLKYIINNDYIVCVGFSKLLTELLKRIGISSTNMHVDVDTSYDEGFTLEEKPTEMVGHSRVLLNITDEKYGIDGLYIADPTWDNNFKRDLYTHSLMTLDETSLSSRMLYLNDADYLFNVSTKTEFNKKLNMLLNKKMTVYNLSEKYACLSVYRYLTELFKEMDYELYGHLSSKYFNVSVNDYYDFFDDVGDYIVSKTNKKISGETIILAAINMKRKLYNLSELESQQLMRDMMMDNVIIQNKNFPLFKNEDTGDVIANAENKFLFDEGLLSESQKDELFELGVLSSRNLSSIGSRKK